MNEWAHDPSRSRLDNEQRIEIWALAGVAVRVVSDRGRGDATVEAGVGMSVNPPLRTVTTGQWRCRAPPPPTVHARALPRGRGRRLIIAGNEDDWRGGSEMMPEQGATTADDLANVARYRD